MSAEMPIPAGRIYKTPLQFMPPFTAFGKIYLPETTFADYQSKNPNFECEAIIAHESTHIKRLGTGIKTYLKYWSDPRFRFCEEMAAIREEMKVWKKYNEQFEIVECAKNLSGIGYLWCTDFETAKRKLEEIWREV